MTLLKLPLMAAALIVLVLALGACGSEATLAPESTIAAATAVATSEPEATAQATTAPATTEAPTAEPTELPATPAATAATGDEVLDPDTLADALYLDSFRSTTEMSWQGTLASGEESSGAFDISVDFVREPSAQHITLSGDAPFLDQVGIQAGQSLEMYVVGDTMYLNLGGDEWLKSPTVPEMADMGNLGLFQSKEILEDVEGARYVGEEMINGVQTRHYTFDESSIDVSEMAEGSTIDSAQGDVYIAVDGDYVVRLDVSMTGSNLEVPAGADTERLSNGTIRIALNLTDVNEPITITVPPEAENSGG